jgi:hypothetical protein
MMRWLAIVGGGAVAVMAACGSFGAADSQPGIDAGIDAGDAAEASTGSFCSTHPATVCSDFDGNDVFAGWAQSSEPPGLLGVSNSTFLSPSHALEAKLDGTSSPFARLARDVERTAKRVRFSYDVKLGEIALSAQEQISIGELLCADAPNGVFDGLWIFVEGPTRAVVGHSDKDATKTPLPSLRDEWTHVVLDARFDSGAAPGGSVVVSIGGATAPALPLKTRCFDYPRAEVNVGLATFTSAKGNAFFDNIVYELDPVGP